MVPFCYIINYYSFERNTMKPQTKDGINYTMYGCILQVLQPSDTIQPGYYVRDCVERPMYSESGGWDTTFTDDRWEGPRWHLVDDEIPGFIGETVNAASEYGEIEVVKVIQGTNK